MRNLIAELTSICNVDWPVTIVGDLNNCPNVNWYLLKAPIDGIQNVFLDFVCDSGFEQMVGLPTRDENVLDLVITSHPLLMSQVSVTQPFANSDHNSVHFLVDFTAEQMCEGKTYTRSKVYLWDGADFDAMGMYLSQIDWNVFMSLNLTTELIWIEFKKIILDAIDMFVPVRYSVSHGSRRGPVKNTQVRYVS